jgi:regulator of protease activity HflC (stomatin/prohibitin superfamily)
MVRYIVPLFAVLVGLEVLLNIVLDLYRPKTPGEMPRPAFDSRLLSLLASPANVVQSLNEAVNYQFGFEITRSWFWRLLSRSFGWLVLFGLMVLVLLSSLVIVEPHELALKTSLGELQREPLRPGVHLKLPWPLAMVTKYRATRVEEMVVGTHEDAHEHRKSLLWTGQHSDHGTMVLLAGDGSPIDDGRAPAGEPSAPPVYLPPMPQLPEVQAAGKGRFTPNMPSGYTGGRTPSVSVAAVEVFIQWKIDEDTLADYATSSENPDQRLRQLANAAVTREMLKHTIDEAMGVARPAIAEAIAQRLGAAVQSERLGIQVVWVSLVNVHPPQEVAEDFNLSAASVQAGQRSIQEGMEAETQILTEAAGSVENARTIVAEHERLQELRRELGAGQATAEQVQAQQAELERLVQQAGGAAARELLAARQRRWELENTAVASAALAPVEYAAYQQAPRYYTQRSFLEVLRETLADKRKFLLMSNDKSPQIDLDLKESIDALSNLELGERAGSGRE